MSEEAAQYYDYIPSMVMSSILDMIFTEKVGYVHQREINDLLGGPVALDTVLLFDKCDELRDKEETKKYNIRQLTQ